MRKLFTIKRALAGAFVSFFLLIPGLSRAGPRLSVDALVDRAVAVAQVKVDFGAPPITVTRWLNEAEGLTADTTGWSGLCLPDRSLTKRWIKTHPHLGGLAHWEKAMKAGGYTAIVFLREQEGTLVPVCESEAMLALGWSSHPSFSAYQRDVIERLAHKAASAVTGPPERAAPTTRTEPVREPSPPQKTTGSSCF